MNCLVVSFLFVCLSVNLDISTATPCIDVNCKGRLCNRYLQNCVNGECATDGTCVCSPCFTGKGCADYADEHPPRFVKEEDTIHIEVGQTGVVYDARPWVRDADNDRTCILGKPCPCSKVVFDIMENHENSEFFTISQTGEVSAVENVLHGLKNHYHKLEVGIINSQENGGVLYVDILHLHVYIGETFNENKDLTKEKTEKEKNEFNIKDIDSNVKVAALNRKKRGTPGNTRAETQVILTAVGGVESYPEILAPGDIVHFRLEIVIPTIPCSDRMDLKVEIFVMDATTGIATFALTDVEIVAFGSEVVEENGRKGIAPAEATTNYVVYQINSEFSNMYERATLDFATLCNTATKDSSANPDYTDSTIAIEFKVILIDNPNFSGTAAIITAGAEFDQENNVYIAQAISDFVTSHTN